MKIKFKADANIEQLNDTLKSIGIDRKIYVEADNIEWLKEINTNPESPQRRLKPTDRDLTMDELHKEMGTWAETELIEFDLYFGRTPDNEMKSIAKFIKENKDSIDYITDSELLIERGAITEKDEIEALKTLQKVEEEPELLSVEVFEKQKELQSGLMLCKSFSPKPFWVLFGKTRNNHDVMFLKEKKYVDSQYNSLYRDSNNYGYMLLPLNDFSKDFFENVFNKAYSMGLREHPVYFGSMIYAEEMIDGRQSIVANEFIQWYSVDELVDRFKSVIKASEPYRIDIDFDMVNNKLLFYSETSISPLSKFRKLADSFLIAIKSIYGNVISYEFDADKLLLNFENYQINLNEK